MVGSTAIGLRFSCPPETRWSRSIGPSVDGSVFQALRGFVLSMCYSIDTTHNALAIVGEFLSCSVDAGFVLALPLHHGDLDSVGISTKDHVAIW